MQVTLSGIMDARGVLVRHLAAALDTDPATVSRWRSGSKPNRHHRTKLIRKLKLTESEIQALGWDEKESACA